MKTYETTVKLNGASPAKVRVQAENSLKARNILESQYGKGSILHTIKEVK